MGAPKYLLPAPAFSAFIAMLLSRKLVTEQINVQLLLTTPVLNAEVCSLVCSGWAQENNNVPLATTTIKGYPEAGGPRAGTHCRPSLNVLDASFVLDDRHLTSHMLASAAVHLPPHLRPICWKVCKYIVVTRT